MHFTQAKMISFMKAQKQIFDIVRLVDSSLTTQYDISEDGRRLEPGGYTCFSAWNGDRRCDNCISSKVFHTKGKMTKFEFVDHQVYFVISMYVVVDEQEFILEMVEFVNDDTLFGAYGKSEFMETIQTYNRHLYVDSLTGAYNRRYFTEQLKHIRQFSVIAMLDLDKFKQVNDTYGHLTGDEVLEQVVRTIAKNIRGSDAVVRYGGDEFLLLMQKVSPEILNQRLEQIRKGICSIQIPKHPNLQISASIGAVYAEEHAAQYVQQADETMYQAKKSSSGIVIQTIRKELSESLF